MEWHLKWEPGKLLIARYCWALGKPESVHPFCRSMIPQKCARHTRTREQNLYLLQSLSFCLFIQFTGFSWQVYWGSLHSLLQWITFCQNFPLWPVCPGWPCTSQLISSLSYGSSFTTTRQWSMKGWHHWLEGITDSTDMNLGKLWERWGIGKPGVLQSMGLQTVRHNLMTVLQQQSFSTVPNWQSWT